MNCFSRTVASSIALRRRSRPPTANAWVGSGSFAISPSAGRPKTSLRASEERFRLLVEEAPDAILLYDFDQAPPDRREQGRRTPVRRFSGRNFRTRTAGLLHAGTTRRAAGGGVLLGAQSNAPWPARKSPIERRIRRPSGEERVCRATLVRLPSDAPPASGQSCRHHRTGPGPARTGFHRRDPRHRARIVAGRDSGGRSEGADHLVQSPLQRALRRSATNCSRRETIGRVLALALHRVTDAEAFVRRVQHLYGHPDESSHDELVLKDGRVLDRFTSPFKTADGEFLGRICVLSRHHRAPARPRNALRASEERFRLLVEEAPDAILLYDSRPGPLRSPRTRPPNACSALRGTKSSNRDRCPSIAPEQPDGRPVGGDLSGARRARPGRRGSHFERRIRRPSGEVRVARATLVRLPVDRPPDFGPVLSTSPISGRPRRNCPRFCASTVARQEADRQRIARELHDIAQSVSGGDEHEARDVRPDRRRLRRR